MTDIDGNRYTAKVHFDDQDSISWVHAECTVEGNFVDLRGRSVVRGRGKNLARPEVAR
jgi:hypothetical protein